MIITLSEAITYLGLESSSYSDDFVTALITAAQEAMEEYCGRNLEDTDVTEDIDGTGTKYIRTREPFQSVTSVNDDISRVFAEATKISSSKLILHTERDGTGRVIEYFESLFTAAQMNIRIVYKAGYSSVTMPANIKLALKKQVAVFYSNWQRAKKGKDVLSSESVDGWSIAFLQKTGLDDEVKLLLEPYINWGL